MDHSPSLLVATLSLLLAHLGADAAAQCSSVPAPAGPFPAVLGNAFATTSWDPDGSGPAVPWLVVGGGVFPPTGSSGLAAGNLASRILLAHDGTHWGDLSFPLPSGPSPHVAVFATFNGELIVGGGFTIPVAGGSATNVARWNGTAWRSLGSGVSGSVAAMTVHNGELVVAGSFLTAGGVAATNIARWNGTAWSPFGGGVGSGVNSLASCNGSLYAGGSMQFVVGGSTLRNLVRWNGASWVAAGDPNHVVRTLAVHTPNLGGFARLFAGGDFTAVGGVAAQHVAEMDGTTQTWSALGAGFIVPCTSLRVRSTGSFTYEVIALAGGVLRWTGTWSGLGAPAELVPHHVSVHAGQYAVCGYSTLASVQVRSFAGAAWMPVLGPGVSGAVEAMVFDGGDLIAGGSFPTIDGIPVNGVARRSGSTWSALGTGVQGSTQQGAVHALARLPNGDIVAGGDFVSAGGVPAANVARWNGSAWLPFGSGASAGVSGPVYALLPLPNGDLVVGGNFHAAGGSAADNVVVRTGNTWQPLGSGTNSTVHALARMPNGDIIAGGWFSIAGGVPCATVARWNGTSWAPLGAGFDNVVTALTVTTAGVLIAGGEFLNSGTSGRNHVARWTGGPNWLPMGTGCDGFVRSLLPLPVGGVLAGMSETGPSSALPALARFDGAAWSTFDDVEGDAVLALAWTPSGEAMVGGDFYAIDQMPAGRLAVLASTCPATATAYGAGCNAIVLAATELPWLGGTFRAIATGVDPSALPLSLFGLQSLSLPISAVLPQGLPGCVLSAAPDLLVLPTPTPQGVTTEFAVPSAPSLLNVQLFHQVTPLQFGAGGAITGVASSNGLVLTLGFF